MEHYQTVDNKTQVRQADGHHMNLRVLGWSIGGAVAFLVLLGVVIVLSPPM